MGDVRGAVGAVVVLVAGMAAAPSASANAPAVDAALKAADAPVAQLQTIATETLPGGAVVNRFGQEAGGVPVAGAGAVVLDQVGAPPQLLFDKTQKGLVAPGEPKLARSAAVAAATQAVGVRHAAGAPSARLVIADGSLAWEVTQSASKPLGDFVVTVDAASGEVVSKYNLIRRASGSARVFVPNAVVAKGDYTGLRDRGDRDSDLLTSLRDPVTLENIKDGQSCLRGPNVNVRVGDERKQVCKDSLDWDNVTRSKNRFEALMAYYHIDRAQQYIQTLDLPAAVNEESQNVVVDTIPDDNSFYSPSQDEIQMGTGGVDDGEDADVFVHEYGHAVQDAQNPSAFRAGGAQTGAQGEGFGDYFAQAYSTEMVGFDPEWSHCVMEWDATSYDDLTSEPPGICLRRTDNPNTRSEQEAACGGPQIHCMGEVWSSALFELRTGLGPGAGGDIIMDKVVLASHELLPAGPTFQEASEALIAADESAYGVNDHCAAIRAELVSRELLGSGFTC